MCDECRQYHCPTGCPNALEPPVIHVCAGCNESIVEGQDYYEVCGEAYCDDCVSSYTAED